MDFVAVDANGESECGSSMCGLGRLCKDHVHFHSGSHLRLDLELYLVIAQGSMRAFNLEMGDHLLHLLLLLGSMSTIAMGAELLLQRGELKEARSNLSVVLLAGADKVQAETWWQLFSTPTQEAFLRFTLQLGEADPVVIPPEGLEKTREIAVAEYSMVKSVEGIGSVDVVSWVLLFNCLSMNDKCDSVAPVVAIPAAASSRFAYATLWKSYSPTPIVSNTPAAQLFNISLEPVPVSASNINEDAKLNLKQAKIKSCAGVPLMAARPPLNTANDITFLSCYAFQSSKILVLNSVPQFEQSFSGSLTDKSDNGCSAQDDVPLLLPYSSSSFLVCRNSTTNLSCANVTANTSDCSMTSALSSSLEAVNNPGNTISSNCSITTGPNSRPEIWFLPKISSPSATSKQFASEGEFCHLGLKTSPANVVCLVNSSTTSCQTAMELDPEILDLLFSGIATDYVDKHRTAFNVDQGQATDFPTITATLLTALLAMVQSTVAFTNSELNLLNKLWKRFSNTPNSLFEAPLAIRLVLMLLNLSLAAALYSPVFAIISTEMDRSNTYQSWGMVADDIKVNTDGTILRAIFIAQGQSTYKSIIPLVSGLLCSLSLLIIGWKTLSRCNTIFSMRKLLKEHDPNMSDELITAKSIDSTAAEYLALKQLSQGEVEQSNQPSQQDSESDRRLRLRRSFLSVPSARSYQPLRIERS